MRKEELKESDKMSSYLLSILFSVASKKKISFSGLNGLLNPKMMMSLFCSFCLWGTNHFCLNCY